MTLLSRLTHLVRTSRQPELTKSAWLIHTRRKQKIARKAKAGATAPGSEDAKIDLTPYRESMQKTLDSMQRDLSTIRTSGAHPGILDST
jgi:Flp pilus assembly protein TadB